VPGTKILENSRLEIFDHGLPVFHDEIFLIHRDDSLKGIAEKSIITAARKCLTS
jgi:hypothetical protein